MQALLSLVIILLQSCGSYNAEGVYVSNCKCGNDTLEIFANNRYYQHFIDKDGKSFYNKGNWMQRADTLMFDGFIWYIPGIGDEGKRRGYWEVKINSSSRILVNYDLEIYYNKVSQL